VTTAPLAAKPLLVPEPKGKVRFWLPWVALAFAVFISIGFYLIDAHWPYRYRNVDPLLQKIFASQVKIDQYHRTYFPNPGFVATGLTLRRNSAPELPPVGSAQSLIVEGRWLDLLLLRKRVRIVSVEGLHIVIPPVGSRANHEDFPLVAARTSEDQPPSSNSSIFTTPPWTSCELMGTDTPFPFGNS
jgi:hypothetical protein